MKKFWVPSAALLSAVLFLSTDVWADPANNVVTHVEGGPAIMREGKEMPAKEGMGFEKKDELVTRDQCVLDVSMNGKAGCRLLPSTHCVIEETSGNAMRLRVEKGNVILNLNKLAAGSTFEVETPTAVAAARGTQFWGRVEPSNPQNPVTTFAVREGVIEVTAKVAGEKFTLQQGQALDIPKDETAAPKIRPALVEEMAAMDEASTIRISA